MTMKPEGWKKYQLGDALDVLTRFAFASEEFVEPGGTTVRLLRGDNVMQGYVRWEDAVHYPGVSTKLERFTLRHGDVVIALDRPVTKAGLKCSVISENDLPCLLVQRVARLRSSKEVSQQYLAQVTQTESFTSYLLGNKTETAVPHISPNDLKSYAFLAPSEPAEQRRLAEILNVWDCAI